MNSSSFEIPSFGSVDFELALVEYDFAFLREIYSKLLIIRNFEKICADRKRTLEIGGPVHLAIGQEAIPVGLSQSLNSFDSVYSAHRSHAHLLALGSRPESVFSEILGKEAGLSGGFGGSMHLVDKSVGFQGSVPIVAGTVPLALGAAFASKSRGLTSIAVAYFGDGAIEEGVVHESLNLASMMELPVLFVCENNYMASHMHLSERQKLPNLNRFAEANGIPSTRIDGNDVISIYNQTKNIVNKMRAKAKPHFIEALTFRQLGHVDWREDIDVGVSRSTAEVNAWKAFDPILRLRDSLLSNKKCSEAALIEIEKTVEKQLQNAWNFAISQNNPNSERLLETVYFERRGNINAD